MGNEHSELTRPSPPLRCCMEAYRSAKLLSCGFGEVVGARSTEQLTAAVSFWGVRGGGTFSLGPLARRRPRGCPDPFSHASCKRYRGRVLVGALAGRTKSTRVRAETACGERESASWREATTLVVGCLPSASPWYPGTSGTL